MSTAARKPFRIETMMYGERAASAPDEGAAQRHAQLMAEISRLRDLIRPAAEISTEAIESFRRELGEAQKLKTELDTIREAIQRTKQEIATLHPARPGASSAGKRSRRTSTRPSRRRTASSASGPRS